MTVLSGVDYNAKSMSLRQTGNSSGGMERGRKENEKHCLVSFTPRKFAVVTQVHFTISTSVPHKVRITRDGRVA